MSARTLTTPPPVAPLRWTRDEYYRLAEDGYFAGKRVMLIDGEIIAMTPQNEPHSTGILVTAVALNMAFGDEMTYRQQMPLHLGQSSDPEPDIAVEPGLPRSQPRRHPTTALQVVVVADSSLAYDTGDKASLYAAGGIADYWVVDLIHNRLIVFRDPKPDSAARFGHAYTSIRYLDRADTVTPLAAPSSRVAVADLLP